MKKQSCEECVWGCKHEEECEVCSDFFPTDDLDNDLYEGESWETSDEYRDAWNEYIKDFN